MAPLVAALPYIMAGTALVGGVMTAQAQRQAGKAQQQQAEYEAAIERNKATAADHNARLALEQAERDMDILRRQRDRVVGQNISAVAKSGLTLGGSAWDVLEDSAMEAEYEIRSAGYRGRRQADAYGQEAVGHRASSESLKFSGRTARRAGNMAAAGTLIGTLGSTAGAFMSGVSANSSIGVRTYGLPKPRG